MSKHPNQNGTNPKSTPEGISKITISGFKSIAEEQSIEIRPLTILAGKNSSGKSSMMQPLLLLKQTAETIYDPGALKLDGPNVKFTRGEQLLSSIVKNDAFDISLWADKEGIRFAFRKLPEGFIVESQTLLTNDSSRPSFRLFPDMTHEQIVALMPPNSETSTEFLNVCTRHGLRLFTKRDRCFLRVAAETQAGHGLSFPELLFPLIATERYIYEIIHVPGLRGTPERTYPVTAIGSTFAGKFDSYTASVIFDWQTSEQTDKINTLLNGLRLLGLTNTVEAKLINDAQVEILVGRTLHGEADDTVSIADVGIGVSQTLPVLVALLAAKPGQLVYIEQPEIHLHPRAQTELAQVLAEAAERGVRVVVETHSSLLLLGIQTLVAEGKLSPDLVKLHWFEQNKKGSTTIRSADLDEGGRFGDWPEDFGDVTLDAQDRFLTAAELHMAGF